MKFFKKFYLDKEKDIIVHLFQSNEDEMTYILETPNHNSGNLITNLAKVCQVDTCMNERNMKIIKGIIPASINGDNKEVYIFRLGGIKIANIYMDGTIEMKARIPAIIKTLMSQTKEYQLPIEKTIVKSYIIKKSKFKTDLHTHMNANLSPDVLIALGIKHQLRYPLYYIKKLNLNITKKQEQKLMKQRKGVEKQFENCGLTGKYLTRKIDDHTFLNFAELILENIENAESNIAKIRTSLAILKDGQAVFTNLEKVYLYRYVFCKGIESKDKIALSTTQIEKIPEKDISQIVLQMIKDSQTNDYKENTLRQDKLLWIGREYQKQGISYAEISDTDLGKIGEPAIKVLEDLHKMLPKIEKETGVVLRFLLAIRRIPLTILKDQQTNHNYLKENLDVLRAVAKSPYVVGSDFVGEEINDIAELKPVIQQLVQYAIEEDEGFTIRIHAGENDSLRDNVAKSIECVKKSVKPNQCIPNIRIGHGLYAADLQTEEGKKLMQDLKESGAIIEFQLTSNVRLNNLTELENHPLKQYLKAGIKCVQGTDGCGFYGIDTIDEQLALHNLLGLKEEDFRKMRQVEEERIKQAQEYFTRKSAQFEKFLNGRSIREAIFQQEEENARVSSIQNVELRLNTKLNSEEVLKEKIKTLPIDKIPVIIAGGSFNSQGRETQMKEEGKQILRELIQRINSEKAYFVVGHKMQGYEKAILDISKELGKKFEIDAIVPKTVSEDVKQELLENEIDGICISPETEDFGIYKSFNYEIFERRHSIVLAFDGNSPVSNLVQEAKNGKAKAKIYVNEEVDTLKNKAKYLEGYVTTFKAKDGIVEQILQDNPEIA